MTSVPPDDRSVIRIRLLPRQQEALCDLAERVAQIGADVSTSFTPIAAAMDEAIRPLQAMLSNPDTQKRLRQWGEWMERNHHLLDEDEVYGHLTYRNLVALGVLRPPGRPGRPRLEEEDWQDWRDITERIINKRQSGKYTSYAAAARSEDVPPDTFKRWKRRLKATE